VKKVDAGLPTDRSIGRGRRRSVRTASNIAQVEELIFSQENAPGSHKSPREIERETGISRWSVPVRRIAKLDLNVKTFKRISGQKLNTDGKLKRFDRCQKLLQRFPNDRRVRTLWFSDEKVFTVATRTNL